jgi:hypothetical protein
MNTHDQGDKIRREQTGVNQNQARKQLREQHTIKKKTTDTGTAKNATVFPESTTSAKGRQSRDES